MHWSVLHRPKSMRKYLLDGKYLLGTVLKMDEFKKSPCGQISPCPGQTLRSNDIRMSFGLLIDLARSHLFRVKVMGFSGVRK